MDYPAGMAIFFGAVAFLALMVSKWMEYYDDD